MSLNNLCLKSCTFFLFTLYVCSVNYGYKLKMQYTWGIDYSLCQEHGIYQNPPIKDWFVIQLNHHGLDPKSRTLVIRSRMVPC